MTRIIALPLARDVERALERLKSLHDGDLGIVDITACGSRAIPALRAFLCDGPASSIYQPRCRAVAALAALHAHDVLINFLSAPREISDPVDRAGEDAVVNAAARALIGVDDARIFPLLMQLAHSRPPLAGIVEALGASGRAEAIPVLVEALREDHTRPAAAAALARLPALARPPLVELATRPLPSCQWETASSRRTRLAAVRLLERIGAPDHLFRRLATAADPQIAAAACHALLATAGAAAQRDAAFRLIELLPRLSWIGCEEAEECLAAHFEIVERAIGERLHGPPPDPADRSAAARIYRSLSRVARRAGSTPPRW
ncbi:MAG TPA: HEAT repeat domain-containing protein [Stellaceae bacterium]|nr:HEAT repeat domain-containing protein [Stellaceae bacterium]